MGGYQPIYDDQAVALQGDISTTSQGVTATTYTFIGTKCWSIILPQSLSAHGGLTAQANNSNPLLEGGDRNGTVAWPTNPLLNQPSMGRLVKKYPNPSFTGNWVNLIAIPTGTTGLFMTDTPIRWLRLIGQATTAGSNFLAFVWTENTTHGN